MIFYALSVTVKSINKVYFHTNRPHPETEYILLPSRFSIDVKHRFTIIPQYSTIFSEKMTAMEIISSIELDGSVFAKGGNFEFNVVEVEFKI